MCRGTWAEPPPWRDLTLDIALMEGMRTQSREFAAIGLWAIALTFMVFGTGDSIREHHNSVWLGWGIFLAVVACVPTGWALVRWEIERHDSVTLTQIVDTVEALHDQRDTVSPLR